MWNYVIPHFNQFLSDLQLEPKHRADAEGKAERIAKSLFAKYYPNQLVFDPNCYLEVGSYGKGNATQPCTDLDMVFILPDEVCGRITRVPAFHKGLCCGTILRRNGITGINQVPFTAAV